MSSPQKTRRLSLPLSDRDEADLEALRRAPEVLETLPGNVSEKSSDAALLHAVVEMGFQRIREFHMDLQYAQIAVEIQDSRDSRRKRATQRPRGTAGPQ